MPTIEHPCATWRYSTDPTLVTCLAELNSTGRLPDRRARVVRDRCMKVVHDRPPAGWQDGCTRAISMRQRLVVQTREPVREVTTATPAHHALALWLVTTEMGSNTGSLAFSAAAGRVFEKMSERLSQLITSVGSEALLRRAVHLSQTEFPFLADVPAAPSTDPLIGQLREAAATVEPSQADQAMVTVLGTLVALLESFLGKDLTFRLLRDVWSDLPVSPASPPDAQ